MTIETGPIDSVSPDPANARKHGQRNLDAIVGSLRRFGQQKPIVVDSHRRRSGGQWPARGGQITRMDAHQNCAVRSAGDGADRLRHCG